LATSLLQFPIAPVRDTTLEVSGRINATGSRYCFESPVEFLAAVGKAVKETEVVIDIGCGIVPMNYFRPQLHLMVEPWREYSDILSYGYAGDKGVIVIRAGALEALEQFGNNSVDSIMLLDVIEHLGKDEGLKVIHESERVAREQIVIFTPLGYMPQHMESGQADGWGLGGSTVQEHRSGWDPKDFDEAWTFYICENFHRTDFKGEALDRTHGAFYAIRNFEAKSIAKPEKFDDFRRWLPVERELNALKRDYLALDNRYQTLLAYPPIKWARFWLRSIRALKVKLSRHFAA
jgi:hypothetical protein